MKTNFENIGGSYSQQGDYLLPTLTLPDENQRQISVWAMRHTSSLVNIISATPSLFFFSTIL